MPMLIFTKLIWVLTNEPSFTIKYRRTLHMFLLGMFYMLYFQNRVCIYLKRYWRKPHATPVDESYYPAALTWHLNSVNHTMFQRTQHGDLIVWQKFGPWPLARQHILPNYENKVPKATLSIDSWYQRPKWVWKYWLSNYFRKYNI